MKKKYLIVNVILILVGVILSLLSIVLSPEGDDPILTKACALFDNLGLSLSTGGVVSLITTFILTEKEKNDDNNVQEWGLLHIYSKRSEMNANCDKHLKECKSNLDIIAYGLKNFRDATTDLLVKKVNEGVKVRIIAPNPQSPFLAEKDREEGNVEGSISQSIVDLINWAQNLNASRIKSKNKIEIKTYDILPLFSYQRIDDYVYVGPNLYGLSSQKSISYEYFKGQGKEYFESYFEKLWADSAFVKKV